MTVAALFAAPQEPDEDDKKNVVDPVYGVQTLCDEPDEPPPSTNVADLLGDYIRTRDDLKTMKQEHKAAEANLEEALDRISMRLREIADIQKVDQFSVRGIGTAFRVVKESYRATDWEAYINWCKETNNFHCIERRPAKLAVKAIHAETGSIPPGLDYVAEQEFQVRKATS